MAPGAAIAMIGIRHVPPAAWVKCYISLETGRKGRCRRLIALHYSGIDAVDGSSIGRASAEERRPTKVAAIALANKIARMVWAMMAKGQRYREPVALAA